MARGANGVEFKCANLEAAMRGITGRQSITISDMQAVTGAVDLSGLGITSVTGLGYLANAQSLDLSSNRIKDLSPLTELQNLRRLDASDNRLKTLPVDIDLMESLEELDISNNPLDDVPRQIADIPRLRKLVLEDCGLRDIPELAPLSDTLKWLSLAGNDLLDYSTLLNLSGLELLQLEGCNLSVLPDLSLLYNLHYLYVNNNHLKKLPAYLSDLPLVRLEAKYNHLSSMPDSFAGLSRLEQLVLTGNAFAELPDVVLAMQSLEVLMLDSNMITSLPAELSRLTGLKRASFVANDIGSLDSFANFRPAWPGQISFALNRLDFTGMSAASIFALAGLGTGTEVQKSGSVNLEIIKADSNSIDLRLSFCTLPDWETNAGALDPVEIRLYSISTGTPEFLGSYDASEGFELSYCCDLEANKSYKLRAVLVLKIAGNPDRLVYYYDDLVIFELAPAPTEFVYPDWLPAG